MVLIPDGSFSIQVLSVIGVESIKKYRSFTIVQDDKTLPLIF